jgi:hypothetical protein
LTGKSGSYRVDQCAHTGERKPDLGRRTDHDAEVAEHADTGRPVQALKLGC